MIKGEAVSDQVGEVAKGDVVEIPILTANEATNIDGLRSRGGAYDENKFDLARKLRLVSKGLAEEVKKILTGN